MRLRTLLLLGYAAVITILIASGTVVAAGARKHMRATIDGDAEALAAALMDEIDLAILKRVHMLQASVGVSEDLQRAIAASNAAYDELGSKEAIDARIDATDAEWRAAVDGPVPASMQRVMDNEASAILRRIMAFHERSQGQPVFAELFVTNRHGANVGQTGRTEDFRQDDEDWWDDANEAGTWVSSEVEMDESAGAVSVDIGIRIDDADGHPLGVMKAVMTVDAVGGIIDEFGARRRLKGIVVEMIGSDGRLIHRLGEDNKEVFGTDLTGELAVRKLMDGQEGAVVEQTARGETLRAFVHSRVSANPDAESWALILNQPTAIVYDPVRRMTNRTVTIGIVGASLAILVGFLISTGFGRMTQRLERTTEALRETEARTRSIVANAVDGIVTADAMGRIETFNPAAERIFGRKAEDVIGKNVRLLMPRSFAEHHDDYLRRYRETGEARIMGSQVEVVGMRADGTEFPLDLALGEMREADKHCYVGVLRDGTERIEAQQALEAAKDSAEGASRSKSQFLANMSHELRTPLNAIIGYSEMIAEELEETADDEDLLTDVGKIRTAGLSLLGLIDQILDLSKVEAGRLEAYAETFDLNVALNEIVSTVLPLMRKRDNSLRLDAPDDLGAVHSDATKVRQILLNLLSNAAKFTQYGEIRLLARREPGETHDWMVFRVQDDGIGMTPEELERVWDAFSQADASTTRRYGGTGLGLTITRKFSELLGGSIDVESKPGSGTTFTVRLPAPEPPPDGGELTADAPRERARTPRLGATGRPIVVVVDDDAASRELVRRYLVATGFEVAEAASGEEGLQLVRDLHPAVVVLDVLMPGMDGWAVLAALREDPNTKATPVVMLTVAEQRDLGFALGVDAYLSKPVSREALSLAVTQYCVGCSEDDGDGDDSEG